MVSIAQRERTPIFVSPNGSGRIELVWFKDEQSFAILSNSMPIGSWPKTKLDECLEAFIALSERRSTTDRLS